MVGLSAEALIAAFIFGVLTIFGAHPDYWFCLVAVYIVVNIIAVDINRG